MPRMEGPFAGVKIVGSPHVDTVRIPYDGSRPTVHNFVLTGAGTTEVPIDTCNKGEKKLLAFPQVWACEKSTGMFSWKHRSLTSLFAEDIARHNGGWGGDYWMYSCRDKEAGLPRNKYLEKISDIAVYGDAYVFKVIRFGKPENPENPDGFPRWRYDHLGKDFIFAAHHGEFPKVILRKLLIALSKQVD